MRPLSSPTWAAFALLVIGSPVSSQVTQLGTPYLSGCAPCCGLAGIGISTLGEPRIGNAGFGVLTQNIYSQDMTLILGQCASIPTPPSPTWSACPALPGGCLVHIELGGPLMAVQPFGVLWSFQASSMIGRVWSFPIPNSATLVGQTFCVQVAGGASIWGTCLSLSNGLSITILP